MSPVIKYPSSKWSKARHYPAPRFSLVIEPFCGGAGYSCWYEPKHAILADTDIRVYFAWRAARDVPVEDWPDIQIGEAVSDRVSGWRQWFPRSWAGGGFFQNYMQDWTPRWEVARSRVEREKLEGWEIFHASYESLPDVEATWFIDPPYQNHQMSGAYRHGDRAIDFARLAEWCRSRRGQVIVCEAEGATWLPFRKLYEQKAKRGDRSWTNVEVVWTNEVGKLP